MSARPSTATKPSRAIWAVTGRHRSQSTDAVRPAETADEFLMEIEKHKDSFYRFVKRTVWNKSVVEDVFSSAVLAAYENRNKYTPGTNFRAWMFRILLNKSYVANRDTARSVQPLENGGTNIACVAGDQEHRDVLQESDYFLDQCSDEVLKAFERLSTAERACIMLRGLEGFSYKEIAETTKIPVATVMTHLHRGRTKLRKELQCYAVEHGIVARTRNLERASV